MPIKQPGRFFPFYQGGFLTRYLVLGVIFIACYCCISASASKWDRGSTWDSGRLLSNNANSMQKKPFEYFGETFSGHPFLGKDLPSTPEKLDSAIDLWATTYHIPMFEDGSGEIALRDLDGKELGPRLTLKNWCSSAMEGSVKILSKTNETSVYNFQGRSDLYSVDCKSFFSFDVSKTKFKLSQTAYGEGIAPYSLVPYRTIASDSNLIPVGSVIYIPAAKGAQVTLANGEIFTHDGYFFAADQGGAILKNHIDVFIGNDSSAPYFPWIKHSSQHTFRAYFVKEPVIIEALSKLHIAKSLLD